jgi:hypothetical protein
MQYIRLTATCLVVHYGVSLQKLLAERDGLAHFPSQPNLLLNICTNRFNKQPEPGHRNGGRYRPFTPASLGLGRNRSNRPEVNINKKAESYQSGEGWYIYILGQLSI